MLDVVFTYALLAAQPGGGTFDEILKSTQAVEAAETRLLAEYDKPQADTSVVAAQVVVIDQQVKAIRKMLEDLDAQDEKLTSDERDTVRSSWSLVMILTAYAEDQKELLKSADGPKQLEEARLTAQCALRRAVMLKESLTRLQRSGGQASAEPPR